MMFRLWDGIVFDEEGEKGDVVKQLKSKCVLEDFGKHILVQKSGNLRTIRIDFISTDEDSQVCRIGEEQDEKGVKTGTLIYLLDEEYANDIDEYMQDIENEIIREAEEAENQEELKDEAERKTEG